MIKIIIPAKDEERSISKVVKDFKKYGKVVVCDNNSTDRTAQFAKKAGAKVVFEKRAGKGFAIRMLLKEKADIYCIVDSDDAFYPGDLAKMLNLIKTKKADMVIGKRININAHNKNSIIMRRIFLYLLRVLFNLKFKKYLKKNKLSDFMSGYRCFSKCIAEKLSLTSSGFDIETEITIQTLRRGFRIVEIPIEIKPRKSGNQKSNILNVGVPVLIRVIKG